MGRASERFGLEVNPRGDGQPESQYLWPVAA